MAHSPTDDDLELQIPSGIDTGAMLTAYIKEKRIYQSALGRSYASVRDYRQRKSLQTSVLWPSA